MFIRQCSVEDVDEIRIFVNECKPLELHTPFTYWTLFNYFSSLCFVMIEEGKIIGFISGIRSSEDINLVYLWQIGVSKDHRGKKYSSFLINHFIKSVKSLKCNRIQVSISPVNEVSYNAFLKYSKENNYLFLNIGEIKYHDQLTDKNEFEILYELQI